MRICVYGAGAVGGHIAGRLATAGAEVSVIARGAPLDAIRHEGLRVRTATGELVSRPLVTDRPADLGPQDLVIVAVKAPALASVAPHIGSLLHERSLVLFVLNGIPWWYFHAHGGSLDGTHLDRLDPGRAMGTTVGVDRTVGGVAYTAGTVIAPGVIRAENPRNRLIVGRPDGQPDDRLDAFAALLNPSGLDVTVSADIRDAVWAKLNMNLIGGVLGVLTASPMKDVLGKPALAEFAAKLAEEGSAIARALGADPGSSSDGLSRLATSGHLQSVAQDLLAGRPMEIDALFRVPLELAELAQVRTPNLHLAVELATQRARSAGLYADSHG